MANEHPFQHLFETLGRTPTSHAGSVNRQAYELLTDTLSVPLEKSGRCILLRAPRAGHGKTHLLSRIRHQLGASHEFIPLHASFGCRIDAGSVIDDTLRCLVRPLPASGGLTVLDLVTRRLFASALQPLVGSGEVPCQDREGALTALRLRPIETFDFHHPNAVTAHWARENFEVLGQRLSQELCQRGGLQVREVSFWVEALFRFAAAPLDHSNRVSTLVDTVQKAGAGEAERLEALLGLVTQLMRVVLIADDLEGFSTDEAAALRFAAFVGGLRQSVDRLDVILSLNQDVWDSAFLPRLSGGLADRLSEMVVELEPLDRAEMAALLESRVPGLGAKVLERIDVLKSGTHARGLIRAAGVAWMKASTPDKKEVAEATPAMVFHPPEPVSVPERPAMAQPPPPPVFEVPVPQAFAAEAAEISWPDPNFPPPPPVDIDSAPAMEFAQSEEQDSTSGFDWSLLAEDSPEATEAPHPPAFPQADFQESASAEMAGERVPNSFDTPDPSESPMSETPEIEETAGSLPLETSPVDPGFEDSFKAEKPSQEFTSEPAPVSDTYPPQATPVQVSPPPFADGEPAAEDDTPPESTFQIAPPETRMADPATPTTASSLSDVAPPPETPVTPEPTTPLVPTEAVPQAPLPIQDSFTPPADPVPSADPVPPVEAAPPPTPADTDRVDDLLRQFRERYGRGSL